MKQKWAGEMVQQLKALTAKPEDLSSIPGTRMIGKALTPKCAVTSTYVHMVTCAQTHCNN